MSGDMKEWDRENTVSGDMKEWDRENNVSGGMKEWDRERILCLGGMKECGIEREYYV